MKKNLLLSIDLTSIPSWQITAMQKQMKDWIETNKTLLPFENLIIFPTTGETKLYWLEGELNNPKDIKTLNEIKDRLQPILEVALDIKLNKGKFTDPYLKKIRNAAAKRN